MIEVPVNNILNDQKLLVPALAELHWRLLGEELKAIQYFRPDINRGHAEFLLDTLVASHKASVRVLTERYYTFSADYTLYSCRLMPPTDNPGPDCIPFVWNSNSMGKAVLGAAFQWLMPDWLPPGR